MAVRRRSRSPAASRRPPTSACCCRTASRRSAGRRIDRKSLSPSFKRARRQHGIVNAEGDAQQPAIAGRAVPHERRQGHPARQPRLRLRCAIEKRRRRRARKSIDYDRLTLERLRPRTTSRSTTPRSASSRASGLIEAPEGEERRHDPEGHPVIAQLNGGPTDNNATLFRSGYDASCNPYYQDRARSRRARPVGAAVGQPEGLTIFERCWSRPSNNIQGVARGERRPRATRRSGPEGEGCDPIPVSGQDATSQGVQNIISG